MTESQAIARIFATYSEEELRNAKDEPEHDTVSSYGATAKIVMLFDDDKFFAHSTRNRLRKAFQDAGHGASPVDAIANARRILKQTEAR